jgi:hypothetical protein
MKNLRFPKKHLMGKKIFYEKQKFDDLCAHYHHDPKKKLFSSLKANGSIVPRRSSPTFLATFQSKKTLFEYLEDS